MNQNNTRGTSARNKLVYRGDNPVFDRLSEDLSFETEKIPDGDDRVTDEEALRSFYDEEASRYDNIFTDKTAYQERPNVINAYSLVGGHEGDGNAQRWPDRVDSVANYFRDKGRQPIIHPFGLSDHFFDDGYETVEDKLKEYISNPEKHKHGVKDQRRPTTCGDTHEKDVSLAVLLSKYTDTPSIQYDTNSYHITQEDRRFKAHGSVAKGITDADVDPDKAVVLADHHVEIAHPSGFEPNLYTICRCCIGLDPAFQDSLEQKGFNVVRDNVEDDVFYPELRSRIKEYTGGKE